MPDGVIDPATGERPSARPWRRPALQLLIAVLVVAAVGALGGVVWYWLWTPPVGVVSDHKWVAADEAGLRGRFSATGWYVVVATVAGLVAGAVVALFLDRVPLLTLAGVVLGSVLGTWLMIRVGAALGPPDPVRLAATAKEGRHLPGRLTVTGRSAWISLPAGALVALTLVFLGLSGRRHSPDEEPAGH
jgi:hypothetical protein